MLAAIDIGTPNGDVDCIRKAIYQPVLIDNWCRYVSLALVLRVGGQAYIALFHDKTTHI